MAVIRKENSEYLRHEEHRRHLRRIRIHLYTVYIFTLLLLIMQIITIYYFGIKITTLKQSIDDESSFLNKKADLNYIDMQAKVRELSSSLMSIESNQTNIREQLVSIKSSTSSDFSDVVDASLLGVVTVATDIAQGSGFFIGEDGYIVTNAHVLVRGRYAEIITYDQSEYPVDLIGYDLDNDIALLKAEGSFNALKLGNSDNIKVGEKVIAIGNPLGLSFTITEGIVSAVNREGPNGETAYIQTDVSLNPGNSGGPLINKNGEVIGINNFKLGNAESIGFALESNYIRDTVNEIALRELNETIL